MNADELARAHEAKTRRLVEERLALGDRIEQLEGELISLRELFEAERERAERAEAYARSLEDARERAESYARTLEDARERGRSRWSR